MGIRLVVKTSTASVCLAAVCSVAFADEPVSDSSQVQDLEKMVVRSQREKMFASDILDSTVISRPYDSKSVDGLLAELPGIDLRRSSPAAGKGTGVFIRGLDESRSLILLNGRPLNGAGVMGGEYVDWALLPTAEVKKIEVLRGVKSAEYGNTAGGVINIITRRDMTAPSTTKINASYGIVGPQHAEDAYENRATELSVMHHANILSAAALDLFAGFGQGEPFLRNNYYERTAFGGELSLKLPWELRASVGVNNTLQRRGFAIANSKTASNYDPDCPESKEYAGGGPGLSWKGGNYYFGDRSYWNNLRTQIDFSLQKELPGVLITVLGHINDQDRTEYFYAIRDTNLLVLERFAKPEDNTWGWNITAQQSIGDAFTFKYGGEGNGLRYSQSDIRTCDTTYFRFQPTDGDPSETVKAADRYGAFVQSFLKFGKRIEASPGIRYDYYLGAGRDTIVDEMKFHGVSPNAGLTVKTWKGGEIALQGAYAHRFPTCPELYWYYGGYRPVDRRDLAPERAAQAELGLSHTLAAMAFIGGSAGVRGYYYRVSDYIRTIFGYQPSRLIYNIDKVTLAGFEAEASFAFWNVLHLRGNYTYQRTEKSGDTYDSSMVLTTGLPELPKHKGNVAIEYRGKGENEATAGLSMRCSGEREVITGSSAKGNATKLEHIDGFAAFRLYGSVPLWSKENFSAKLKAGIDNLFNADYSEFPGIPMPGITGTAAVEVNF
ncbi:MAG: TonB-dependent receptor plug domain-containing protein [Chitinispirillaceae bacterium]|nr:TonB-dependent receptor plug domain-containing protein [Chitinispirillaceae bacterium]